MTNLTKFIPIPERDYEMQSTQVTQALWIEIMGVNPSHFKGDNLPVEMVSWNDCKDFIKQLNEVDKEHVYGLPTAAEWEYCCRAGSKTDYCFGNDESELKEYAWFYQNSEKSTHPVAQKKPNDWGLYDIHGNVWEWCEDLYNAAGSGRVLRGGSWFSDPVVLRSAVRIIDPPHYYSGSVGFRLLRTKSLHSNPITLDSSESAKRDEARKHIKVIRSRLRKLEEILE